MGFFFRLMRPGTRPRQGGTAQLVQGTYSDYLSNFAPNAKATSGYCANKKQGSWAFLLNSTTDRAVYYHNHLITGQVSFSTLSPFSFPFRSSVTQTLLLNCVSEKSAAIDRSKRKERRKTELMSKHIMKIGYEQEGCVGGQLWSCWSQEDKQGRSRTAHPCGQQPATVRQRDKGH